MAEPQIARAETASVPKAVTTEATVSVVELHTRVPLSVDEHWSAMDEGAEREEAEPDYELDNLAGWYRHLIQAYPEQNVSFLGSAREALHGFQSLRFSADEDGARRLRADFTGEKSGKVSYSISELSEGQRCLLALYMILHFLIIKGHTVFIDEPDILHRLSQKSSLGCSRQRQR